MRPGRVRHVAWVAAAITALATLGVAGARVAPTVVVSPQHAGVGSEIAIVGAGLSPRHTLEVYLDRGRVRVVVVGADGEFAAHVRLPLGMTSGLHWVSVVRPLGPVMAQAPVWVEPLSDSRWSTSIRDLDEKEQVVWTDVLGEWASPRAVTNDLVIAIWRGSVSGPSEVGGRATITALDRDTGEPRWSYRLEDRHVYDPFFAQGRVVLVADRRHMSELIALDEASGRLVWSVWTDRPISEPVLAGRTLAGSTRGESVIEGFDATTGHAMWAYRVGTRTRVSQPDIASMLGTADGIWVLADVEASRWLLLLDPKTGLERRRIEVPRTINELLAAVGNTLYVSGGSEDPSTSTDGLARSLGALDAADGSPIWIRSVMPPDCRTQNDRCIPRGIDVVANDRTVIVRSLVERAEKEPCPLGCAFGRTILALEPATGTLRWHRHLEKDWEGGPGLTLAGDTLYTTDANLRAIWVADGSVLWSMPAPASPEGVRMGQRYSDGGIAIGTEALFGTWGGLIVARTATVTGPAPVFGTVEPSSPATPAPAPAPSERSGWRVLARALLGIAALAVLSIGLLVWLRARRQRRPPRVTGNGSRPTVRTPAHSR